MTFRAPVRELAFAMKTAGFEAVLEKGYADTDFETVEAVLEAAGALSNEVLAPLNRVGDTVGAKYENGKVTAAPGFAEAYKQFAEGGWTGLVAEPEFGGQGLPKAVELAVFEMVQSANMAFALCPMLSLASIEALTRHGTERQKTHVLPKLISGEWTGAMVLTEPQAGTDLAALTTVAKPDGQGGYELHGQKIFVEVHGGGTSLLPNMKTIMDTANHPNVGVCWNSNPTDLAGDGFRPNFDLVKSRIMTVHMRRLQITNRIGQPNPQEQSRTQPDPVVLVELDLRQQVAHRGATDAHQVGRREPAAQDGSPPKQRQLKFAEEPHVADDRGSERDRCRRCVGVDRSVDGAEVSLGSKGVDLFAVYE